MKKHSAFRQKHISAGSFKQRIYGNPKTFCFAANYGCYVYSKIGKWNSLKGSKNLAKIEIQLFDRWIL
jgi:hypothetical protein